MSDLPRIAPTSRSSTTHESLSSRSHLSAPPRHQEPVAPDNSRFTRFKLTWIAFGKKLRALTAKKISLDGLNKPSAHKRPTCEFHANRIRLAQKREFTAANDINIDHGSGAIHATNARKQTQPPQIANPGPLPNIAANGPDSSTSKLLASIRSNPRYPQIEFPDVVFERRDIYRVFDEMDANASLFLSDPNAVERRSPKVPNVDSTDSGSLHCQHNLMAANRAGISALPDEIETRMSLGQVERLRLELKSFIYRRIGDTPDLPKQRLADTRYENTAIGQRSRSLLPRLIPSSWQKKTGPQDSEATQSHLDASAQRSMK